MLADFGVLVGLTLTWFSEEMLISNICIHGFMCSEIKKSWKVSNEYIWAQEIDLDFAVAILPLELNVLALGYKSTLVYM